MPKALITGITGQDGSYLAELLLAKEYEVHGVIRRTSSFSTGRIDHIFDRLHLHYGDLTDAASLCGIVHKVQPDEVYNLGAQSHVRVSFDMPSYTYETIATGTMNLLECVRRLDKPAKFYQASSSEMFGNSPDILDENARFMPQSPYACAKVAAYYQAVNYRESKGMFVCNGILFNHESPRRGETFVTRKITRAAARIHLGLQTELTLGNLDAIRDWGFAGDYVEAMWQMMQLDQPDDFVIATGRCYSVRDFLEMVFSGYGRDWREVVRFDERLLRPAEVHHLRGEPRKAFSVFGWEAKTSCQELAEMMRLADLEAEQRRAL